MAYKFQVGSANLSGALAPTDDDSFDLGAAGKEWKDLYLDGTANIDVLAATAGAISTLNGAMDCDSQAMTNINVDSGAIDGTVIGANSVANGSFAAVVGTTATFSSTLSAEGDVDLGNAATDSVTVTGRFDSDLLPIADSTSDLGSTALQWAEAHIDHGYIDAITATGTSTLTTVDINGGNIDGTAIGAASQSSVKATTLSGSSTLDVDGNASLNANVDIKGAVVNLSGVGAAALDAADLIMSLDSTTKDVQLRTRTNVVADFAGTASSTALAASAGVLSLDIDSLSAETIATGDTIVFNDDGDDGLHKVTFDNMMTKALPLLTEAAMTVADDYIVFLDGSGTGDGKKEKWADLVALMAGTGLTASGGQLSTSQAAGVNGIGDADATLTESFNYATATISTARTWTLPASAGMSVGDVVHVKLAGLAANTALTIARAGSQTIDGATSITMNSAYSAVSLKYVDTDTWRIF